MSSDDTDEDELTHANTGNETARSLPGIAKRPAAYSTLKTLKEKREKKYRKKEKALKVTVATQTEKYMEIIWLEELITNSSREKNALNPKCEYDSFVSEQLSSILFSLSVACGFLIDFDALLGIVEFFNLRM
ncbi:uncharacterized protein [Drosophila virilis]|uniref:Uncharacterized protein, isoform A n=1 Tax=Drosophila virilis TaxID=7244 RepID=A0A0Q9W855_DROVI|nr:uncharacterized protein LOC26530363 isoform X2 [Drosophila virilis]KRF78065.1 uncharacterized protein Dvir_GJ25593, isoform A [Drosophila virilis]